MARMHWNRCYRGVFEEEARGSAVASDHGGRPGFLKTLDSHAKSPALLVPGAVGSESRCERRSLTLFQSTESLQLLS